MSKFLPAETLMEEGNYKRAISEYQKLLSLKSHFREKADINQKINTANSFYESAVNISIGEVFFPVVNRASSRGLVLTGKVSIDEKSDLSQDLQKKWTRIKKITADFLDEYLVKEIKTVMVLDWQMDRYEFSVKPIHNSKIKIKELLTGGSLELAMFISLLSIILNEKVENSYAFSGEVNENYTIGQVDGIKEKTDAIKSERTGVNNFIVPHQTGTTNKIHKVVDTLADAVSIIFPTLNKILRQENSKLGKRRLTLIMTNVKIANKVIDYADFDFGNRDNIDEKEGEKIYRFLQNNIDRCKNHKNGLIISGLTISYSAPMFVVPLYNQTPKFLAIRYTAASSLKPNEGAAYVIHSNDKRKYKPGEMIRFNLPVRKIVN